MAEQGADFTLTFRRLCDAAAGPAGDEAVRELFADGAAYDAWAGVWRARLESEPAGGQAIASAMRMVNPAFIPRNHLVEEALNAAIERDDFGPFGQLIEVLSRPFDDNPAFARYAVPPQPEQLVLRTFCGT